VQNKKQNPILVYLSLGGNVGDTATILKQALDAIGMLPQIELCQVSRLYRTSPVGVPNQAPYTNLVCCVWTALDPKAFLTQMQAIERQFGKVPKPQAAPRLIDIDIVFYGEYEIKQIGLEIPHPRWKERLFVLIPLLELTPYIFVNTRSGRQCYYVKKLIESLSDSGQAISLLQD
jgi:2-amino-4-hydroxy-6-hydroxymethyldihydropteridine diphosphokinase